MSDLLSRLASAFSWKGVPPTRLSGPPQRYVLSSAQQRFWAMSKGLDELQNTCQPFLFRGVLDVKRLEDALQIVVERQHMLRTSFHETAQGVEQRVHDPSHQAIERVDFSHLPSAARHAALMALYISKPREDRFPLDAPHLFRLTVARMDVDEHVVVQTLHPLIGDVLSHTVFWKELSDAYAAVQGGVTAPPLPLQYGDFAEWERHQGEAVERDLAYWRERFSAPPSHAVFPPRVSGPPIGPGGTHRHRVIFPAPLMVAMQSLAKRLDVTPMMLLISSIACALHRYTGQQSIPIGVPVNGRLVRELSALIGHFGNMVIIPAEVDPSARFCDVAASVRRNTLGAFEHQFAPFPQVLGACRVPRVSQRMPLVSVMLNYFIQRNQQSPVTIPGIVGEELDLVDPDGWLQSDVVIFATHQRQSLDLISTYDPSRFDDATFPDFNRQIQRTLEVAAADPDARVGSIPMVGAQGLGPVKGKRVIDALGQDVPPGVVGQLSESEDLALRSHDGRIEIVDALAETFTLGGTRVVPKQLEQRLSADPAVSAALVERHSQHGGDSLAVCLVPSEGAAVDEAALIARLYAQSPELPACPVRVVIGGPDLLRPDGKLDRPRAREFLFAALHRRIARRGVEPRDEAERRLVEIWKDALGCAEVGVTDNFFELGGHSMSAVRAAARATENFGRAVTVMDLFRAPTIEALARKLGVVRPREASAGWAMEPLRRAPNRAGPFPLSPAQERICDLVERGDHRAWPNAAVIERLDGPLDVPALRGAFADVVGRHDILTATVVQHEGRRMQAFQPGRVEALEEVDLSGLAPSRQDAELKRRYVHEQEWPFDLKKGPLFRATLFRLGPAAHVLLFNLSHFVSDGASVAIFLEDCAHFYAARVSGRPATLVPLTVQYGDYALWQHAYLTSGQGAADEAFWREHLRGTAHKMVLQHPLPWPTSLAAAPGGRVDLPLGVLDRFEALCRREGGTTHLGLLAAFHMLLRWLAGGTDQPIALLASMRSRVELEPLMGCFVSRMVIYLPGKEDETFPGLLARTASAFAESYAHARTPLWGDLAKRVWPQANAGAPLAQPQYVDGAEGARPISLPGITLSEMPGGFRDEEPPAPFPALQVERWEKSAQCRFSGFGGSDVDGRIATCFPVLLNLLLSRPGLTTGQYLGLLVAPAAG